MDPNGSGETVGGELLDGRYLLLRVIGRGRFGRVYQALHVGLRVRVAIKAITAPPGTDPGDFAAARGRFQTDARQLMTLDHPHCPRVRDYFCYGSSCFLVMDYVQGEQLAARLRRTGPLPLSSAVRMGIQISDVLAYLHRQNPPIILGGVRSSGILATRSGRALLVDLGVGRRFARQVSRRGRGADGQGDDAPNGGGDIPLGPQADVFGLGVVLGELVTGARPWNGTLRPSDIDGRVPEAISGVLAQALSPDLGARFQSAQDMGTALRAVLDGLAPVAAPPLTGGAGDWEWGQPNPGDRRAAPEGGAAPRAPRGTTRGDGASGERTRHVADVVPGAHVGGGSDSVVGGSQTAERGPAAGVNGGRGPLARATRRWSAALQGLAAALLTAVAGIAIVWAAGGMPDHARMTSGGQVSGGATPVQIHATPPPAAANSQLASPSPRHGGGLGQPIAVNPPTPTPSATASATPDPTATAEPTATPEPTATVEPTATPEATATPEPTVSPTASVTGTATGTATTTVTPRTTPSRTPGPALSPPPGATTPPSSSPPPSTPPPALPALVTVVELAVFLRGFGGIRRGRL